MGRLLLAVGFVAMITTAGCEDECFDYYPHHETPTTQPDVIKSGSDYYGGHNAHDQIVIPGSGSSTNPAGHSATTESGLP